MVSILGNCKYEFPKPIPLTKTMKDYLEDEVDEKYYINSEKAQKLIDKLIESGTIPENSSNVNEIGFIESGTGKHQSNTVYSKNGICPCEYSVQHKEPFKILE